MDAAEAFEQLVSIMARLRGPGGCPWDHEQTHATLKPYLVEETYEVIDAIDDGGGKELCEELGDLLLQIVFHAQMAGEAGTFTIKDVVEAINAKLIRRHPHVFAGTEVADSAEVVRNWSRIKAEERRHQEDRSALAGVPRSMPALLRAQRIGEKAAGAGFDWTDLNGVLEKVEEELAELKEAVAQNDTKSTEAELGDLLLSLTSAARHLHVSAEDALEHAIERFSLRFRRMEATLAPQGRDIRTTDAEEKEALWQQAKRNTD